MDKLLTVLTPTYNRASLLSKCFKSLLLQTCKNFEWLIIDDGSTDDTATVVEQFKSADCGFDIIYKKKENGGKHTALNYAHQYIRGKYTLILDSDDSLVDNAVEVCLSEWQKYDFNSRIWCLSFLKGKDLNNALCEWKSEKAILSNHIDFRINKKLKGDCAEVVKSEVFKKFKFPVFSNEKFMGENYIWIKASYDYDTVYIKKIIYLCEYLEGGLTKSGRSMRLKNPFGGMLTSNLYLKKRFILNERIKKAILFDTYAIAEGHPYKNLKYSNKKVLCFILMPIGWFFYLKWRKNI